MRKSPLAAVLLAAATLALSACSGSAAPDPDASSTAAQDEAVAAGTRPLPAVLDDADGLQTVAEALKVTGIAGAFEGEASYTLLAPTDDAFAAAGERASQLLGADDHAPLAAFLRAHMLPGYVTLDDINAAISAAKDGEATMETVSGDALTFTRSGDAITVAAADGTHAQIAGTAVSGGASIAIPIDGLLKPM